MMTLENVWLKSGFYDGLMKCCALKTSLGSHYALCDDGASQRSDFSVYLKSSCASLESHLVIVHQSGYDDDDGVLLPVSDGVWTSILFHQIYLLISLLTCSDGNDGDACQMSYDGVEILTPPLCLMSDCDAFEMKTTLIDVCLLNETLEMEKTFSHCRVFLSLASAPGLSRDRQH